MRQPQAFSPPRRTPPLRLRLQARAGLEPTATASSAAARSATIGSSGTPSVVGLRGGHPGHRDLEDQLDPSPSLTSLAPLRLTRRRAIALLASASKSIDYIGTVRGRLGYLFTPTLLVYATGGLATARPASTTASSLPIARRRRFLIRRLWAPTSYSDTRVGWAVGGGLESIFLPELERQSRISLL